MRRSENVRGSDNMRGVESSGGSEKVSEKAAHVGTAGTPLWKLPLPKSFFPQEASSSPGSLPPLGSFLRIFWLLRLARAESCLLLLLVAMVEIPVVAQAGTVPGRFYLALVDGDLGSFLEALQSAAFWLVLTASLAAVKDLVAQCLVLTWRRTLTQACHRAYAAKGFLYRVPPSLLAQAGMSGASSIPPTPSFSPSTTSTLPLFSNPSSTSTLPLFSIPSSSTSSSSTLSHETSGISTATQHSLTQPTLGSEPMSKGHSPNSPTAQLDAQFSPISSKSQLTSISPSPDSRHPLASLDNPDQRIAAEIQSFCASAAEVLLKALAAPAMVLYYLVWVGALVGVPGLTLLLAFFLFGEFPPQVTG